MQDWTRATRFARLNFAGVLFLALVIVSNLHQRRCATTANGW